ncbi:MAG: nucleoside phosphorylase [Bacteroidota bacterium]
MIPDSELILNPDGSIYHLHLRPEHLANTIITVGDPDRVAKVSQYFDEVEVKIAKREFVTHTGTYRRKRLTVLSTGIGTDNIDIVLNELDALVNIDLETRTVKPNLTSLQFIRIGTTGGLQAEIPLDTFVVSTFAIGMDGLMHFYPMDNNADEYMFQHEFMEQIGRGVQFPIRPYFVKADRELLQQVGQGMLQGATLTNTGFYAPQGRSIRAGLAEQNLLAAFQKFRYRDLQITNLEMETAGIYGLAKILGHRAISCSVVLANRAENTFSEQPAESVDRLIRTVLDRIASLE